MRTRRLGILLILGSLLIGAPVTSLANEEPPPPHPLPVFRSVLDGNPRMVTLPLHEEMWLTYDAQFCQLQNAWSGGVKFDGAVYTTVHGPQPTSTGFSYTGHFYMEGEWRNDDCRFLGYRVDGRTVTLRYSMQFGRRWYTVEETPSFRRDKQGRPGLRRTFRVRSRRAPRIRLRWPVRALVHARSNEAATMGGPVSPMDKVLPTRDIMVRLRPGDTTYVEAFFDADALRKRAEAKAAEEATVRAKDAPTAAAPPEPAVVEHPKDTPVGNGVSVRVYHIGASMSRIRKLVPGQTPNVSHVIPVLDLRTERGDFGDIDETFITHVDGFLEVETAGVYRFRLLSDDGSRLYLNDEVVIDHDGLHGVTAMEGKLELAVGRHKLFVEHFENGGGEQLTLEWQPPGAADWAIVPNEALRAPKGEVRVTSPGKKKLVPVAAKGVPGDGQPLTGVHPAFDLAQARPESFQPRIGGIDWLPDGRMIVCCWEPMGGVYVLEGAETGDPAKIEVRRIAAGLAEPLGIRVVNGRIFVLQKQELTELIDRDGDGAIDEYRTVADGWGVTSNFHEFAFGLVFKDGAFYATLATAINPGGASTHPQNPDRGKVVKIDPDGRYELIAHGLRTPNGIGLGVHGEIFVTDNQGDWLPVSKVVHVSPGAFFGSRSVDFEGTEGVPEKPPVVWLPQGEIGNSPGEPGLLTFGPWRGQMLHADVTHGGLKRVFVEKVCGQYQGCVFRFIQGLEAGINRWRQGPDGALYVGGIGSSGNWGQTGKLKYGLQRLAYNGKSVFEMKAVRVKPNRTLEIEFTEPLANVSGDDPADYLVQQWWYEPTKSYGGPKKDVERLEVAGASVSKDRRKAWLRIPGLEEGHVVYLRLARTIRNAAGDRPWSSEAWYTLNRLPGPRTDAQLPAPPPLPNRLTPAEQDAGWKLLFDGETLAGWRGYKQDGPPAAWRVEDGALHFSKEGTGGDLVTETEYAEFDLKLEWKLAPGGNSGVCYRLTEDGGAMWTTGPEMQVLDNDVHADGGSTLTSAGACYALFAPRFDVTRPAGAWNQARIVVANGRLEHWLNGWKIVDVELGGEAWNAAIAKSKFQDMEGFGVQPRGHIGLQDHGDPVWYRNIKIRIP